MLFTWRRRGKAENINKFSAKHIHFLSKPEFTGVSLCLSGRRLLDTEDDLSDLQADSVPTEVRDWLACTFSRKMGMAKRRPEEKPRFRSIVHAVQAGIFVER